MLHQSILGGNPMTVLANAPGWLQAVLISGVIILIGILIWQFWDTFKSVFGGVGDVLGGAGDVLKGAGDVAKELGIKPSNYKKANGHLRREVKEVNGKIKKHKSTFGWKFSCK